MQAGVRVLAVEVPLGDGVVLPWVHEAELWLVVRMGAGGRDVGPSGE